MYPNVRVCLSDTAYILAGRCEVVDYLLRDYAPFEEYAFRITVLRSLLRTVVYILNFGNAHLC